MILCSTVADPASRQLPEVDLAVEASKIESKIQKLPNAKRARATCKLYDELFTSFRQHSSDELSAFRVLFAGGLAARWNRENYYHSHDLAGVRAFVRPTSFHWQRAELLNDRVTAVLKAKEFYTKWQASAKSDYYANMLLFDALSIGVKVPEKAEVIKDRVKALLPESDERWLLFQAKYLMNQRSQQPSAVSLAQVKGAFERYIAAQTDTPATNRYLSDRLLVMLK